MAYLITAVAALALAAPATAAPAAPADRILLCRAAVEGDPAVARAEPLAEAGRGLGSRFLDYPVACETVEEAARAAGRAGLGHGIWARVSGRPAGAGYLLVLTTPEAVEVARREVLVPIGADGADPLRLALRHLDDAVPRPPIRTTLVAGWALAGAGAVGLAAGAVLASRARADAREANGTVDPATYQAARERWRRHRGWSGAALAGGGVALAAGLTLVVGF